MLPKPAGGGFQPKSVTRLPRHGGC